MRELFVLFAHLFATPFDAKRMFCGGFKVIVAASAHVSAQPGQEGS